MATLWLIIFWIPSDVFEFSISNREIDLILYFPLSSLSFAISMSPDSRAVPCEFLRDCHNFVYQQILLDTRVFPLFHSDRQWWPRFVLSADKARIRERMLTDVRTRVNNVAKSGEITRENEKGKGRRSEDESWNKGGAEAAKYFFFDRATMSKR